MSLGYQEYLENPREGRYCEMFRQSFVYDLRTISSNNEAFKSSSI